MSTAREQILQRIGAALRDVPERDGKATETLTRAYRRELDLGREEIIALFTQRVTEYQATVTRVRSPDLADTIAGSVRRAQIRRLAVPIDLPASLLPHGIEILRDESLSPAELDATDCILSGCALGIAETGTIVLDGGPHQGRRVLSLLPDYFLCVIAVGQIVGTVPQAIDRLRDAALTGRPITFISGPSATSDIELIRVEGVHGPRTLEVVVVSE